MTGQPLGGDHAPLILTAAFDRDSAARFEAERRAHFPAALNRVPAHLTLFHALPGSQLADIAGRLRLTMRGEPPIEARAVGLFHLGRGVAYQIETPRLVRLRDALAEAWLPLLSAQDRAPFRPHVTIQNKATPEASKALLVALQAGFRPLAFTLIGLDLWWYRGGPWEEAGRFRFR